MACIGAESACVDVDALFSSCWEQNDSLTRFVCSMIATPRLAVFNWIRRCKQAAVEVQSVSAAPVVALLEESASADAELETVAVAVAVTVDASTVTAAVSTQAEKADEAEEAKKSVEPKKKASSFLELLAQEDSVASLTSSVDSVAKIAASSAKVAAWLGVKTGSEQDGLSESEAQQGGKVLAEVRSGWYSLSRNESSCSSRSACLIHLSSDSSSSSSSSAGSLCSSPSGLMKEVAGLKRGIGRGVSCTGKGCSISALCSSSSADHSGLTPSDLPLAAENNSVNRGIVTGVSSSGKGWSTEVKGFGKAEEKWVVSNQLYGYDDDGEEVEEEEDGSSRQRSKVRGGGTMCYMNQVYMDEEEEAEREALAASGISLGIGRFGARRRITGSSSRVTLHRISGALRQY